MGPCGACHAWRGMTKHEPYEEMAAEELRQLGVRAVEAAASVVLTRFRAEDLSVSEKSSQADVVTDADIASEKIVRELILANRPNDAVVGEEGTLVAGTSGITWVLDPIDSTANFARGIPIWSISLAAIHETGVVAGIVSYPLGGEVISGTAAAGVLLNGSAVRSGPAPELAGSMVAVGWGSRSSGRRQSRVAGALIHRVGKVRSPGSPALGLAWTALGRFDAAYYEMDFSEWDVAAGAFLCECAGLVVRREDADADDCSPRLLAARPEIADAVAGLVFG